MCGVCSGTSRLPSPGWYELLSQQPGPRDANFGRPSPRPLRLALGTPFFFKLKSPHHAIAGYGRFAGFSVLPDWLAWETFGEANGVKSLAELRERLSRIQVRARITADPAGRIGCSLIAEARFFPRNAWVTPPANWRARPQTGAGWDLSRDEGLRIWEECVARTSYPVTDTPESGVAEPRFGAPVLRLPRLGQGIFRVRVLDAYARGCAITNEHSLPVLEAASVACCCASGVLLPLRCNERGPIGHRASRSRARPHRGAESSSPIAATKTRMFGERWRPSGNSTAAGRGGGTNSFNTSTRRPSVSAAPTMYLWA